MSQRVPRSDTGQYVATSVGGETVRAFVPPPLPPHPPVDLLSLIEPLSATDRALGRLDGISVLLSSHELFLHMCIAAATATTADSIPFHPNEQVS